MKHGIVHICMGFMLLLVSAAFAAGNLREGMDPGFEMAGKYWRTMFPNDAHSYFSTNGGINGSGALVITSEDVETETGFYAKGFVPIVGGHKYTLEVRVKGKVKHGYAYIAARMVAGAKGMGQDANTKFVKTFEGDPLMDCQENSWSSVHCSFTAPKECNAIHIKIATREFLGTVFFDDVAVYEMDDGISIPQLTQSPAMDGRLDPSFAKEATRFTDFMSFPIVGRTLAKDQTEVYVGMTTEFIYLTFMLHHGANEPLISNEHSRDNLKLFSEDSVELFISRMGKLDSVAQIAANAKGAIYDALDGNANWNCKVEVATGKENNACDVIQLKIPLNDLGYNHAFDAGSVQLDFIMSFCRNHTSKSTSKHSTWTRLRSRFDEFEAFRAFRGLGNDFGRNCSDKNWKRHDWQSSAMDAKSSYHYNAVVSWEVKDPLFKELITDVPHTEKGESAYIWPRPLEPVNVQFGLQYGVAYSRDEILKEYEAHRLHPFTGIWRLNEVADWERKTGIGHCLYFPYNISDFSASYDPAVYDRMFSLTRKALEENPDTVWGISLGDEAFEHLLYKFIDNANDEKKLAESPPLREAVRTVKEKYGFGKFGVPSSSSGGTDERFQWLATKNYMYDRLHQMQRDLYKLCREYTFHGKPLVCISCDPVGGLNVIQQQSRDKDYCDIFTGQVVPVGSRWRQNICFTTKVLKDFTDKSVWPCAHVEPYIRSFNNKATAAFLSEVARGGGSGLQMWNYDFMNSRRRMGDTCFDYLGHRPRWDTIMEITDIFRDMNQLRFPKDDMAIFFSNDTMSCYRNPPSDTSEALFTFAGPSSRAWFKFICGVQLRDNEIKLNNWRAIMFANADVEFIGNQRKFHDYVKNGGTLVCFDPTVFTFNEDSTDTTATREAIFGARSVAKDTTGSFSFLENPLSNGIDKDDKFSVTATHVLEALPGTKVLARFDNGDIAATIKEYPGGGKAVLFAVTPKCSHVAFKSWRDMMKLLIYNIGIKTDQDIWRFQFPHKEETIPEFKDKCLTGNFFHWFLNEPLKIANARDAKGSYSYTLPPDGDTADRTYQFGDGNLCNRFKAIEIGDYYNRQNATLVKEGKISTKMFFDTWSKTDAFDINIDLGAPREIHSIKLFFNGQLPSVKATLDNGSVINAAGIDTKEVDMLELKANGKSRHIKLSIPAREDSKKLILSEMEIWGK
ncbi:MAG: hypothetical protein IJS15_14225 [Victivallales bacterium]|nr:hypothetical protein [Victivallales bacterium]